MLINIPQRIPGYYPLKIQITNATTNARIQKRRTFLLLTDTRAANAKQQCCAPSAATMYQRRGPGPGPLYVCSMLNGRAWQSHVHVLLGACVSACIRARARLRVCVSSD